MYVGKPRTKTSLLEVLNVAQVDTSFKNIQATKRSIANLPC